MESKYCCPFCNSRLELDIRSTSTPVKGDCGRCGESFYITPVGEEYKIVLKTY